MAFWTYGASPLISLASCAGSSAPPAPLPATVHCDACAAAPPATFNVDLAVAPVAGGPRTTVEVAGKLRTRARMAGCGLPEAALGGALATCGRTGVCGDGSRDAEQEKCDDGNAVGGDGYGLMVLYVYAGKWQ